MKDISLYTCECLINSLLTIVDELKSPQATDFSSREERNETIKNVKNYLLLFSLIRIFIVCKNDKNKIYEIREVFYKYGPEIDLQSLDFFSRQTLDLDNPELNFSNFFDSIQYKIFFCLRFCDFEHLINIFDSCERHLLSGDLMDKIYLRQNREFASIFNNLRLFFFEYNNICLRNDFNDENILILKKNLEELKYRIFNDKFFFFLFGN